MSERHVVARERMEKRTSSRFDKVFPVSISSRIFGELHGIARNISSGGMFLEVPEPLPLGSIIRVHFAMPDSDGEIVARGEVKGHYYLNFSDAQGPRTLTGMGVRFIGFEEDSQESLEAGLGRLRRARTLH
jgi:hypothetical protein